VQLVKLETSPFMNGTSSSVYMFRFDYKKRKQTLWIVIRVQCNTPEKMFRLSITIGLFSSYVIMCCHSDAFLCFFGDV